jgi:hypothetical protein
VRSGLRLFFRFFGHTARRAWVCFGHRLECPVGEMVGKLDRLQVRDFDGLLLVELGLAIWLTVLELHWW